MNLGSVVRPFWSRLGTCLAVAVGLPLFLCLTSLDSIASGADALEPPAHSEDLTEILLEKLLALEVALAGRNLLLDRHPESYPNFTRSDEGVPRSSYASTSWRF